MDAIIEKNWFKVWVHSHYPVTVSEIGVILSAYSPWLIGDLERENNGDDSAFLTFGVFRDDNGKYNVILFSIFPPAILNPAEVIVHARNLCYDYLNNSEFKIHDGPSPDILLVPSEKEVRGGIHSKLGMKNNSVALRRFFYEKYGKTLDNMLSRVLPRIAEGRVWLAANPIEVQKISLTQEKVNKSRLNADSLFDILRNVDAKFLSFLCSYPSPIVRPVVWALVQVLMFLEIRGVFSGSYHLDGSINPKNNFYGIN